MATPLYARYVPPKVPKRASSLDNTNAASTRIENEHPANGESSRKRKRDGKDKHSRKKSRAKDREDHGIDESKQSGIELSLHETPRAKSEDLDATETSGDGVSSKLPKGEQHDNDLVKHRKKKSRRTEHDEGTSGIENGEGVSHKHSKILAKFEKSVKSRPQEQKNQKAESPAVEEPELHDLVPIPVPEAPRQAAPPSAFALLPEWLSKPIAVPANARKSFEELEIDSKLLQNLRQAGFEKSLPVQGGVLPLLLPIRTQHPGDLCVSAATGSGKTLGYVLPIVQDLTTHMTTSLRALIIVPTRELVDQVRDTTEMCCSGTGLHVGTAVGTQHFETEQSMLVEKSRKYDPAGYRRIREKLERKISFLDDDVHDDDNDELDPAEELLDLLTDHVPYHTSKVDILITTPGRLVDHIKSTAGFDLSNLEWLVIDEADRLLDASFQDWVDTLNGAINISNTPSPSVYFAGPIYSLRKKQPRKVVLSATMTRDLDKLSGLHLRNPKLVVVEGTEEKLDSAETKEDRNGIELPDTLIESAIPVGDGSEKPLYLLALLHQIFDPSLLSSKPKDEEDPDRSELDKSSVSSSSASDDDSSVSSTSSLSHSEQATKTPTNALIFTSSNESAHRLSHIIAEFEPEYKDKLSTLTKSSTSRSTAKILASFRSSSSRILIATDRASRGLDLPNLQNVINYDIPHGVTSYVHRVGRTARAGKDGRAWTLVEDREAAWFWKQVAKGDEIGRAGRTVERKRIDLKVLGEGMNETYQKALAALEKSVKGDAPV